MLSDGLDWSNSESAGILQVMKTTTTGFPSRSWRTRIRLNYWDDRAAQIVPPHHFGREATHAISFGLLYGGSVPPHKETGRIVERLTGPHKECANSTTIHTLFGPSTIGDTPTETETVPDVTSYSTYSSVFGVKYDTLSFSLCIVIT
jgi:hypothetical protein